MWRHKASHSRAVKQHLTRSVTKEVASMGDPENKVEATKEEPKEEVKEPEKKADSEPSKEEDEDPKPKVA
jgi:hypothetical protein